MPVAPVKDFDITQFHVCEDSLYWHGCYGLDTVFKKYVTPESFAHPAKMSFLLCERIFKHLEKLGLLQKYDVVCDFMAGSGRTNVVAFLRGYDSIAVELEPHFRRMIEDNIVLTKRQINRKVEVKIIQGDSRHLSQFLAQQAVGIVSPPYQDTLIIPGSKGSISINRKNYNSSYETKRGYSSNPQNIGNLKDKVLVGITSPPYQDLMNSEKHGIDMSKISGNQKTWGKYSQLENPLIYSSNPQNIGNLKDKQLVGVTSPPYEEMLGDKHHSPKADKLTQIKGFTTYTERGQSKQNIGNLKDKTMIGITSPPYENQVSMQDPNFIPYIPENLGDRQGESYLQAMLQVYKEAVKVMPVLVTVTKNPTRSGKLRRLDLDTVHLLQLAGYRVIDYHRAVLFEERKQATFLNTIRKELRGRLSFFKRLSLRRGNVVAQYEDILICAR